MLLDIALLGAFLLCSAIRSRVAQRLGCAARTTVHIALALAVSLVGAIIVDLTGPSEGQYRCADRLHRVPRVRTGTWKIRAGPGDYPHGRSECPSLCVLGVVDNVIGPRFPLHHKGRFAPFSTLDALPFDGLVLR